MSDLGRGGPSENTEWGTKFDWGHFYRKKILNFFIKIQKDLPNLSGGLGLSLGLPLDLGAPLHFETMTNIEIALV